MAHKEGNKTDIDVLLYYPNLIGKFYATNVSDCWFFLALRIFANIMHGFVLLFLVEQLETQRCTLLRGLRWRC